MDFFPSNLLKPSPPSLLFLSPPDSKKNQLAVLSSSTFTGRVVLFREGGERGWNDVGEKEEAQRADQILRPFLPSPLRRLSSLVSRLSLSLSSSRPGDRH